MYCENCGVKLLPDSFFCTNCGKPIKSENVQKVKEKVVDDTVKLNIKPTFKFWYLAVPYLFIFLIISSMFLPILAIPNSTDIFVLVILGVFAIMVLVTLISIIITKKQYEAYNYDFYKTKVVYSDSFINISEKEVKYKYIREVVLRIGFFQRWFNIGTITLYTNAETGMGNGISIYNVENAEKLYKEIKELIDQE